MEVGDDVVVWWIDRNRVYPLECVSQGQRGYIYAKHRRGRGPIDKALAFEES